MRKDIIIPEVENVYIVAIKEWNEDFGENSWYAYILNNSSEKLEMAMVVSHASGIINNEERKTGNFRHMFNEVLPETAVKVELLENNVLQLNNYFMLTYFQNGKLYEKNFTFEANSIIDDNTTELQSINRIGVIGK
ncbi:hypothetical protein [Flavobacterium urocaniciphilum]|uniref:Phenylalanyl-tRNA synthetase subunit alpha n=1 Tax=Flavobacterium urocaniciphilum TaxID=1299341 RepID=A0A1H8YW79_9FLAO|nr:hypothetical protein [Flavobacterium urocaniciphilum]SEP56450.1 hypothetical protein SAMN05444005_101303 [Flavobacterium urocaniciphilum]